MFVAFLAVLSTATPTCSPDGADIIFVIDGSSSALGEDFISELQFVANVTQALAASHPDGTVRTGLVQFSDIARLEYGLQSRDVATAVNLTCPTGNCSLCFPCAGIEDYYYSLITDSTSPLANACDTGSALNKTKCCYEKGACQVSQLASVSYLSDGLLMAHEEFIARSNFDYARILVFLLDDSIDSDELVNSTKVITDFSNQNVLILGVGVNVAVNETQLKLLVPDASKRFMVAPDDGSSTDTRMRAIVQPIAAQICAAISASPTPSVSPSTSASNNKNSRSTSNTVIIAASVSAGAVAIVGAVFGLYKYMTGSGKIHPGGSMANARAEMPPAGEEHDLKITVNPMHMQANQALQDRLAMSQGK